MCGTSMYITDEKPQREAPGRNRAVAKGRTPATGGKAGGAIRRPLRLGSSGRPTDGYVGVLSCGASLEGMRKKERAGTYHSACIWRRVHCFESCKIEAEDLVFRSCVWMSCSISRSLVAKTGPVCMRSSWAGAVLYYDTGGPRPASV